MTASAAARRGSKPKGTRTPRGEGPAAQPRKAQGADDKAHEAEFRGLCHVHDVVELQVGTDLWVRIVFHPAMTCAHAADELGIPGIVHSVQILHTFPAVLSCHPATTKISPNQMS